MVLAVGGTDRPRQLDVPGGDLPLVTHDLGDPHTYFRQHVCIVGGRNSAIDAALRCYHAGAHVTLVYRGSTLEGNGIKYWLVPEFNSLVKSGRIVAHFGANVDCIEPTHVTISTNDGQLTDVPTDFVLAMIGYEQDTSLLRSAGVELSGPQQQPVYDEVTMQTNVPGIYVAGTAVGGTQRKYHVFIENCHVHVQRIMQAMFGIEVADSAVKIDLPES